jgi:hypothetical protein
MGRIAVTTSPVRTCTHVVSSSHRRKAYLRVFFRSQIVSIKRPQRSQRLEALGGKFLLETNQFGNFVDAAWAPGGSENDENDLALGRPSEEGAA